MNVALVAMLGLGLAQPPAASDYHPFNSRNIKFPIQFAADKVKSVRKVELHVSNDGGQVWQLAAVAPPTQDMFAYTAPVDGRYWFHIVEEDLRGKRDPVDLTKEAPAMKVLFDTKSPVITITTAKRTGDEVILEWRIDDQFPKDDTTRVHFRPAGATEGWQEVTVPASSRNGVRFAPGISGAITVRISTADLVGNKSEAVKDVEGTAASTSFSPGIVAAAPTIPPPMSVIPPPVNIATPAGGPLPPPNFEPVLPSVPPTVPAAPSVPPAPAIAPPVVTPPVPTAPMVVPTPSVTVPSTPASPFTAVPSAPPTTPSVTTPPPAMMPPMTGGSVPVPTFDPRSNVIPTSGTTPAPTPPANEPKAQVINSVRFDLNYQVEQRGPSGISRVDLWVTRDDGKSWSWWSQHEGRDSVLKVNLGTATNTQPEGLYGFRLVPVSGAGLSDASPVAGDTPDMRVVVDTTAPLVKIYPATSDPNTIDALLLQWEATDKNFGDDPITLEWCEGPTGPWRPIVTVTTSEAMNALGVVSKRIPNSGKHAWKVPAGLPPRVYLKVTARDAAGNMTEQVTRDPILVDLTKPRAKITSIGATPFVKPQ